MLFRCAYCSLNVMSEGFHFTSCFYLQMTDVEAGGATVFPEIGLRLVPEKV